jgi:hypothetical protein
MNGLTVKVTLLLQRLRDINMTSLFKDLSDDDKAETALSPSKFTTSSTP